MAKNVKIRIRLKGYDHNIVDRASELIVETAKRNGASVSGPIPLPTDKEIITILRAVHKYKDSREQFELRTHKRLIDIIKPSPKAVEAPKAETPAPEAEAPKKTTRAKEAKAEETPAQQEGGR